MQHRSKHWTPGQCFYSNPPFLSSFCSHLFWLPLSVFFVSFQLSFNGVICYFTKHMTRTNAIINLIPIFTTITPWSHHRLMVSGAWLVTLVLASPQAVIFRWWKVLHLFLFTSSLPQGPQTSCEGLSPGMKKYKITRLWSLIGVIFSYLVDLLSGKKKI